jgi:hypothetical protein
MIRHLTIIAIEFRLAGILLAIPAVAAPFPVADLALTLRESPPPDNSEPLDIGTYGIIALTGDALRLLGPIAHAMGGLAGWALAFLASRRRSLSHLPDAVSGRTRPGRASSLG